MIEQDKREANPRTGCHLARGIEIGEEVRINSNGEAPVVIDNAGAAVGKHEPAGDAEAERGHLREITLDRQPARGDAEVRSPDVRAEIETVVDGRAVGRPRVIAAVPERMCHSSFERTAFLKSPSGFLLDFLMFS